MKKLQKIIGFDTLRDINPHFNFCQRNDSEMEDSRRLNDPIHLDRYGYKVYSQNDEDGIIEEIFNRIGLTNKIFIEFGVQNGLESNGHFLLHKGWKGLWIDGNSEYVNEIKDLFRTPIANHQLTILNEFITAENINHIISDKGGIKGEIDLLSIDIDGNDYWIWNAINCISPRVVVIEYNVKFPPTFEWIIDYNPSYIWDGSDNHSASLKSLELLGNKLGYQLVGTNMNGTNAFFVKKENCKDLFPTPATAENLYHSGKFRYYFADGHKTKKYIGK